MKFHYILDARAATAHFPGIGRYVRNLAPALMLGLEASERLTLLWQSADATAWNPGSLASGQVSAVAAPWSPFGLEQQWRLPRLLRRSGHEAASGEGVVYHSPYYLMPYRPGVPTVVTIHDLTPLLLPETVSGRARLLFRLTTRLALAAAGGVVCDSASTLADLQAHFDNVPGRAGVAPLAADPRFVPQNPEQVAAVRLKYDLPERYLLYFGINKPHKNLVRLVEAFGGLDAEVAPALVIAGAWDGRYPEAKTQVARLGLAARVHFLGPIQDEDLPGLFSGCEVFVFPSLYEGFGLPVIEAMACGAAVVCSAISSLPEVGGDAACYVDPLDVEDMRAKLAQVLSNEARRAEMRRKSLAQARRFSWGATAEKTLAMYRQLASARAR